MRKKRYNDETKETSERLTGVNMTTNQAAELLGVTPRSIINYINGGKLPAHNKNLRVKLINLDDLRKFASTHKLEIDEQLAQKFLSQ
jgi:predicted transcriptional regulator